MREERARPSGSRTVGAADDLHGKVEVGRETLHDLELLVVLLSENRQIGHRLDQQLADDGCDAGKEVRPELGFEAEGRARRNDFRCEARWIDLVHGRREHQIHLFRGEFRQILFPGAGIACEVLVRRELRRIDEYRHDDAVGTATGEADERNVPGMKRPHRWNKGDGFSAPTPKGKRRTQRLDRIDNARLLQDSPAGRNRRGPYSAVSA